MQGNEDVGVVVLRDERALDEREVFVVVARKDRREFSGPIEDIGEFQADLEEWKQMGARVCTLSPFTLAQNSLPISARMKYTAKTISAAIPGVRRYLPHPSPAVFFFRFMTTYMRDISDMPIQPATPGSRDVNIPEK